MMLIIIDELSPEILADKIYYMKSTMTGVVPLYYIFVSENSFEFGESTIDITQSIKDMMEDIKSYVEIIGIHSIIIGEPIFKLEDYISTLNSSYKITYQNRKVSPKKCSI